MASGSQRTEFTPELQPLTGSNYSSPSVNAEIEQRGKIDHCCWQN